ncbi:MAG: ble 2 [Mucilaginibacter sp.]|nr:ble 2 [Mucilaginibacter sp.]
MLDIFVTMNTTYPKIKKMSPLFVVADLERSLDFYTRELGFEIDFRYEDFYAGIIRDSYTVHLKLGSTAIEERANRRENEHLDLVFSVEDIQSLFEAIKSRPVIIVQPLREMPYGSEFYITDPDGYILGFIE